MRQTGEAVLAERLVPEDFDRELPLGSIGKNTRMGDAETGNDVGCLSFIPVNGVAGFDEQMMYALIIANGLGPGLREDQDVHCRVIPMTGQAVQGAFLLVQPNDVAVDGEEGSISQQRQRLLQSATGLQKFGFIG